MPLDPLNYINKNEYTAEVQKLPGYVNNQDGVYRDNYLKEARNHYDSAWAGYRKQMMQSPSTSEAVTAAETKGAPWAGGAEMPRGFRPGEGGLPSEAPWDTWFKANVGKPVVRGAEAGLGWAIGQQTGHTDLGSKVWQNPGQYPAYRSVAGMGGLLETPEGMAVLAASVAMPEILGAYGWAGFGEVAPEAGYWGQLARPALRFGSRVGTMGATGAAINAPKAYNEGDPTSMFMGAAQVGVGQAISEAPGGIARGAVNIFGRGAMRAGYGEQFAAAITKYFPRLANDLSKEEHFSKIFAPDWKDARGTAVSLPQKIAREDFANIDKIADQKVSSRQMFTYEYDPGERQAMYGEIDPKTGQPKGAPGQYEAARPSRPGRPAGPPKTTQMTFPPTRQPKGQPGAGRVIKQGYTKTVTSPGTPEIPPTAAVPERQIMTFQEAKQFIRDAEQVGHDMSSGSAGKIIYNRTGVPTIMRGAARRMTRVLADDIDNIPGMQGLGKQWGDAKFRDMFANVLTDHMREDGVMRGAKLGVPELQQIGTNMNAEGYWHDYIELMGEKEGKSFLTSMMNGADPTSSPSVRGKLNPFMRAHALGGMPTLGLHLPTLSYMAGPPAPETWRGLFPLMKRFGASGFARMLLEASGMDEPYDHTPVMRPQP